YCDLCNSTPALMGRMPGNLCTSAARYVAGADGSDARSRDAGDVVTSSRSDDKADDPSPPATRRAEGPSASLLVFNDVTTSPPPRASHPARKRHQRAPPHLCRGSLAGLLLLATVAHGQQTGVDARIERLLARMTLQEKLGQLTEVTEEQLPNPTAGELLSSGGAAHLNEIQRRSKIPLLVGYDV